MTTTTTSAPADPILALLVSLGGYAWVPTAGSVWSERDGSRVTPAGAGDVCGEVAEYSGAGPAARAPADAAKPPLAAGASGGDLEWQPDGGDDSLHFTSPPSFAGELTLYVVGYRPTASAWFPVGGVSLFSELMVFSDNNVYFQVHGGGYVFAAYTGSAGLILARCRRMSGTDLVKFAATGMSEANLGIAAGTFAPESLLDNSASLQRTDSGGHVRAVLLFPSDTVASGQDAAIVAALVARFGAAFP